MAAESGQYPCPACGFLVFAEPPGSLAQCPVCRWRDDDLQLRRPRLAGLANADSMEARQESVVRREVEERYRTRRRGESWPEREPSWRPLSVPQSRWKGFRGRLDKAVSQVDPSSSVPYYWLSPDTRRYSVPLQRRIVRVEQAAGRRDVQRLLWYALDPMLPIAQRAREATADVLRGLSAKEFVRLDESVRRWRRSWPEVLPGDDSEAAWSVRSCSGDGHEREAAVRRLAEARESFATAFLLIRVNDWVAQVRAAALSSLEAHLTRERTPQLVRCLGLLEWLESVGRTDQRALIRRIEELLCGTGAISALSEGLNSQERAVRRCCFRLLTESFADRGRVVRLGLASSDVVVRIAASRLAVEMPQSAERTDLLHQILKARPAAVRLRAFVELQAAASGRELVERALLDAHPAIRALGRKWATAKGLDAPAFYRERVCAAAAGAAVAGLGETGDASDVQCIEALLSHELPAVRREALSALERLAPGRVVRHAAAMLVDQAGSVSRRSRDILRRHRAGITPDELWNAATGANSPPHGRRHALSVLWAMDKWVQCPYLVRACASEDSGMRDLGEQALSRWQARFNQSFTIPSQETIERIEAALRLHRDRLSDGLAKDLLQLAESVQRRKGGQRG